MRIGIHRHSAPVISFSFGFEPGDALGKFKILVGKFPDAQGMAELASHPEGEDDECPAGGSAENDQRQRDILKFPEKKADIHLSSVLDRKDGYRKCKNKAHEDVKLHPSSLPESFPRQLVPEWPY